MGPPFGQPRRPACRRRLDEPQACGAARAGDACARLLEAQIKAYEIQGILALENCVQPRGARSRHPGQGRDRGHGHVADGRHTAADRGRPLQCVDRLRARCGPTATRRTRACASPGRRATPRRAAFASRSWAMAGEPGYPTALSAPRWGFQDALFGGRRCALGRPLRLLRCGEHPLQDQLPRRVPRPDRGGGRPGACMAR